MTKTKIVDFEELYNFVVDDLIWNYLSKKIMFEFLMFEIQNFQTISDRETTKDEVVVLDDIYNSVVEIFFI
jgi:hypothetical protein